MTLDTFQVRIDPRKFVRWPDGGGFPPLELLVNGRGLVAILREIELPLAVEAYDRRVAQGDDPMTLGPRDEDAGFYDYLPPEMMMLPCRNLFGHACDLGLDLRPEAKAPGRALLLGSALGRIEDGYLHAAVALGADRVTWSDFRHSHRPWTYALGPFAFDREAYEAELSRGVTL